MKLPWFLFLLLCAMCVTVGVVFSIKEIGVTEIVDGEEVFTARGHGFTHPEFSTMQRSGSGADRHEPIFWVAYFFGLLQVIFFVALLGFGGRRQGRVGLLRWPLIIGGAIFAVVWTVLFVVYRAYMRGDSTELVLAFPAPTAVMLYAVWGFPVFFLILYVVVFDRWIFTPEDQEKFDRIVQERRKREENVS